MPVAAVVPTSAVLRMKERRFMAFLPGLIVGGKGALAGVVGQG
jgi:hypothetical protein